MNIILQCKRFSSAANVLHYVHKYQVRNQYQNTRSSLCWAWSLKLAESFPHLNTGHVACVAGCHSYKRSGRRLTLERHMSHESHFKNHHNRIRFHILTTAVFFNSGGPKLHSCIHFFQEERCYHPNYIVIPCQYLFWAGFFAALVAKIRNGISWLVNLVNLALGHPHCSEEIQKNRK